MSRVKLIKWGNSAGIRIPIKELKAIHAYIGEQFDIASDSKGGLILRPIKNPQAGWTEAFNHLADNEADKVLDVPTDFEKDEWTW